MYLVPNIHPGSGSAGVPTVTGNFAVPLSDYSTLTTTTTMPTGGSISRAGNAMLYDSTGKLTYAPNNLLTYSEQFDNAAWSTKQNCTVSANAIVAPDGTSTADAIIPSNATNSASGIYRSETTAAPKVASFYVKKGSKQWAVILGYNGTSNCWFDLDNGIVGTRGSSFSASSIQSVGNGWFRISAAFSAAISTTTNIGIYASDADNSLSCVGDGTTIALYAWGAQVEAVTYQTTPSTYVATTSAAYYGPRFDYDPSTLAAKGLLIEGARTNIAVATQNIGNSGWTTGGTITVGTATTSPDGTANGNKINDTAANSVHQAYFQTPTLTAAPYTFSMYLKSGGAGELTWAWLGLYSTASAPAAGIYFNLSGNGSLGTADTGYSGTIIPVGGGWYRCSITVVASAGTYYAVLRTATANGTNSYAGTGVGIYAFGAQLEAASFASSYVANTATSGSVARSPDTFSITGYSTNLIDAFYTDEATGNSYSMVYNAGTAPSPSFGWLTSLRAYTNAYAGDITTPSWIDNQGTSGNRMVTDSSGMLTWAASNELSYSQDYRTTAQAGSTRPWVQRAVTPTSGFSAPDATSTAYKISEDNTTNSHDVYAGQTYPIGINFVWSIYAKAGERNWVWIDANDGTPAKSWVNLTDGTKGTIGSGVTLTVQPVGSGWYRISAFKLSAGTSGFFNFGLATADNVLTYAGTTGSGAYFWGAQLERVTYQGSARAYIPTTSAALYNPRYDYDASTVPATPRGMLIEESRANSCPYSQDFSNAAWVKTSFTGTVTQNTSDTVSPDGTANAAKFNAAAANDYVLQAVTLTAAAYTYSIYLKAGTATSVRVNVYDTSDHYTVFNVAAGTAGTTTGVTSSSITSVGNGWYRCSITFTAAAVSSQIRVLAPAAGTFYAYGAMVEAGSFATSYIPTTSLAVTRVPDVVKLSGSALTTMQGANVSLGLEYYYARNGCLWDLEPVAAGSFLTMSTQGVGGTGWYAAGLATMAAPTLNAVNRQCISWNKTGNFSGSTNNSAVASSSACDYTGTSTSSYLGSRSGGSTSINSYVRSLAIYNQRLPDAILKQKSAVNAPY